MVWTYSQSTGKLKHDGALIWTGYSGKAEWKNKPEMEELHNKGPIPRGRYRIGPPHQSPTGKGPHVMSIQPVEHNAHGRTLFLFHGDSISSPGNASEGCIIIPLSVRQQISGSGDTILIVTE